jgi:NTE family protein
VAYHAAALAAIKRDLGWEPRSAEVVVGTSAGSLVALLRRGDRLRLSGVTVGVEPRATPPVVAAALRDRPEFPVVRLGSFLTPPRLPSLAVVAAWAAGPGLDPVAALVSVLPDGTLDLPAHAAAIERALGTDWPADDLWICTVRHHDLRRVGIGRSESASLTAAVCASCAVPGYFRPVRIADRDHIDGGVRSPTNADVLRGSDSTSRSSSRPCRGAAWAWSARAT